MAEPLVRVETAGRIATVWLDNPPVNAVSAEMLDALHAALDGVDADRSVRCTILAGRGEKAFCAGADLRRANDLADAETGRAFRAAAHGILDRIEGFRTPVVAAIQGWCIGGGTALAWTCDIRIAAETARFRAGDAYLGVLPNWGMGLLRLPRLVGRSRAMDILLLGEDLSAQRACEMGLVSKVVPDAELMAAARAAAERLATASPAALLATRQAVQFSVRCGWDEAVAHEEAACAANAAHPDFAEGMAAFVEKRKPVFRD